MGMKIGFSRRILAGAQRSAPRLHNTSYPSVFQTRFWDRDFFVSCFLFLSRVYCLAPWALRLFFFAFILFFTQAQIDLGVGTPGESLFGNGFENFGRDGQPGFQLGVHVQAKDTF